MRGRSENAEPRAPERGDVQSGSPPAAGRVLAATLTEAQGWSLERAVLQVGCILE
jgi:hypothetical protein